MHPRLRPGHNLLVLKLHDPSAVSGVVVDHSADAAVEEPQAKKMVGDEHDPDMAAMLNHKEGHTIEQSGVAGVGGHSGEVRLEPRALPVGVELDPIISDEVRRPPAPSKPRQARVAGSRDVHVTRHEMQHRALQLVILLIRHRALPHQRPYRRGDLPKSCVAEGGDKVWLALAANACRLHEGGAKDGTLAPRGEGHLTQRRAQLQNSPNA